MESKNIAGRPNYGQEIMGAMKMGQGNSFYNRAPQSKVINYRKKRVYSHQPWRIVLKLSINMKGVKKNNFE